MSYVPLFMRSEYETGPVWEHTKDGRWFLVNCKMVADVKVALSGAKPSEIARERFIKERIVLGQFRVAREGEKPERVIETADGDKVALVREK